jgi:NAD(P)-dependent dehydrogenase (short-subunit alcohol dehydrogenase family)
MEIKDTTAVVTGAASGLGAATASLLAARGARVIGFDLASSIAAAGPTAAYDLVPVDVTDPDAVGDALDVAAHQVHPLRIVVSCAGIAPSARVLSRNGHHDLALYSKVVQVNLVGTFTVMTLAADRMARNEPLTGGQRGAVVNTASIAGYEGQVGQAAYASSKAGVIGLTISAARDLAQYGIRVNTIAPGVMETPMLATVAAEYRAALAATVPFPQRLGEPDEYADLAAFLIEHDYLNGETVRMDGALRMAAR